MERFRRAVASPRAVKMVAAVIVGLSVGTLVPPEPVTVPTVGPVSGILVGGIGLVVGGVLYLRGPRVVGSPECGCSGDCGCS